MQIKDYLTLGFSILALVVTVLWNLHNRKYTNQVADRIRSDNFALDEWRSKRAEVLRNLREVEAIFDRLRVLISGAHTKANLDDEIETHGRSLIYAFSALLRELERINHTWLTIGYGKADAAGETDWDHTNTILAEVRALNDPDDMRSRLSLLDARGKSIAAEVNAKLNERTAELDPANSFIIRD